MGEDGGGMMKPARRAGDSSSGSTFKCARGVGVIVSGTLTQGTTFVTTRARKEGLGLMMVDDERGLRR